MKIANKCFEEKLTANKMRRFQKKYDSAVSPPPARKRCWASIDARKKNKANKPLIGISVHFLSLSLKPFAE